MEGDEASIPDWRDGAAYAALAAADRAILAWEWLRRDPGYRAAAAGSGSTALPAQFWGLHCFEDPVLPAPKARPLWTSPAFGEVLIAEARPSQDKGALVLAQLAPLLTLLHTGSCTRLLVSDGWRVIRLDVNGHFALEQPVCLTFSIPGPPRLGSTLPALCRFEAVTRLGRFARLLPSPGARAGRLVLLLRTADALAAGATQREIAAGLIDAGASRPGWRDERPDLRLRAQRLVRDARACRLGGYRHLLRRG